MKTSTNYRVKDIIVLTDDIQVIGQPPIKKDTIGKIIEHPQNGIEENWYATFPNYPYKKINECHFIKRDMATWIQ